MSSRPIPTSAPDATVGVLNIVKAAMPTGATAGTKHAGQKVFVLVRSDLQNMATPISRYCRVGLSAFYEDTNGNHRTDLARNLANTAVRALLDSRDSLIIAAEWQSGPVDTTDPISDKPVAYATVLLEVKAIL